MSPFRTKCRRTFKLLQTYTYNPRDQWIRAEGCIEPIVDGDTFAKVNKFIEERRVDLTEEEMPFRLRRTLLKEGKLSKYIIDRTPGLPCVATCQTHFGSLRNLYRLLGYTPKRNYEFLDSRPLCRSRTRSSRLASGPPLERQVAERALAAGLIRSA